MVRKSRSNSLRNRRRQQRGGSGQQGRTVLPIEYFGGASNAYVDKCEESFSTAYGPSVNTSFGASCASLGENFRGPNLAPGGFSSSNMTSGIQTGGAIISDTDSTDNLGSSDIRWANVYTDSLGDNGQDLAVAATTLSFDAASTIDTSGNNNLTLSAGTATINTYRLWQPLKGGRSFVYAQTAGWTLYGGVFVVAAIDFTNRIASFLELPSRLNISTIF